MDYETITRRCKHAFNWWYENNKPVWHKHISLNGDWLLAQPCWRRNYIYIADDENAKFAKAIIDGKKIEIYDDGKWIYSIYNNINRLLLCGLVKNGTYRIKQECWKPEKGKMYYFVNERGYSIVDTWIDCEVDKQRHKIGNCFQTRKDCENAIEAVKETLNKFHKEE